MIFTKVSLFLNIKYLSTSYDFMANFVRNVKCIYIASKVEILLWYVFVEAESSVQ